MGIGKDDLEFFFAGISPEFINGKDLWKGFGLREVYEAEKAENRRRRDTGHGCRRRSTVAVSQ